MEGVLGPKWMGATGVGDKGPGVFDPPAGLFHQILLHQLLHYLIHLVELLEPRQQLNEVCPARKQYCSEDTLLGIVRMSVAEPWHHHQLQETAGSVQPSGEPRGLGQVEIKLNLVETTRN
jgi:hypothetical protein